MFSRNKLLVAIFLCCFLYWGYLMRSSAMLIQFDAIGYKELGETIYKEGWEAFLKTGPHREPLYPFLIAVSMKVADMMSAHFELIQKIIQVALLFVTQLMLLALLKKAKVHEGVIAAAILYFGFSPAIVNASFSLYSEIAAFPSVPAIVWGGWYSWRAVHCEGIKKVIAAAALTALAFAWATFVKGIFQYIFLVFIVPFIFVTVKAILGRNIKKTFNGLAFIAVAFVIFSSFVFSYRYANKHFNGNFELTNRYDGNLFGTAAKRVNKLTPELLMAHLASVPGAGVCRSFFSEETCQYCEFFGMDLYRSTELEALLSEGEGTSKGERARKTISLAFEKIAGNPAQYLFLTAVESLKMAFWESTQIGFVAYPKPLEKLFDFVLFKNGIRFLMSILTYFSLFYLLWHIFYHRSKLRDFKEEESAGIQTGFFALLIIVSFTGLYAIFSILTRFALPIASLYIFCIALAAQNLIFGDWERERR